VDERDELQQKIADIAGRYIQRTAGELAGLRDLIGKARAGNATALKDIEHLAHKIYGSGAMFGFEAVSDRARALELAAKDSSDPGMLDRLQQHADGLEQQVQAALRARGVQ
jgi:HPt (histidine-containing phosphotransfer) domain-containing protein